MANQFQYCILIRNNYCRFMAFINDIPAFHNMKGMALNTNMYINPFLKNGMNIFRVEIFPPENETTLPLLTDVLANIIVKRVDQPVSDFQSISEAEMPVGTITESNRLPGYVISGKFEINFDIEFLWVKAPRIDEREQKNKNIELGIRYIQQFYDNLKNKNLDILFNEIKQRESEIASAYFDTLESSLAGAQEVFQSTVNDPNWQLQPLNLTEYLPRFYAHGKLLAMENLQYQQPIFYINKAENLRREFPIYLCLNEDKKITLIR